MSKLPKSVPGSKHAPHMLRRPQLAIPMKAKGLRCVGSSLGDTSSLMVILNKSEAETLQQILNGERLWSWPNGRIQLGQSFPDLSVIISLVRQGLLDQTYEPTEAGRAALQAWQSSIGLPATTVIRSADGGARPRLSTD